MSMSHRAASLAAAALLVWGSAGLLEAASRIYRSAEWGFEFAYPDTLAAGRYKDTLTPQLQALLRETGQEPHFYRRQLFRKEWETTVGGRTVYKLPGYPGPYGAAAFYYLLPLRDDLVVELFAHRRHMDQARTDTGYDRVIEGIIATFKSIPPGG
jgi:hypothetical protein